MVYGIYTNNQGSSYLYYRCSIIAMFSKMYRLDPSMQVLNLPISVVVCENCDTGVSLLSHKSQVYGSVWFFIAQWAIFDTKRCKSMNINSFPNSLESLKNVPVCALFVSPCIPGKAFIHHRMVMIPICLQMREPMLPVLLKLLSFYFKISIVLLLQTYAS